MRTGIFFTASPERADAARSWGECKRTARNPAAQLVGRHQIEILCVEAARAVASEPTLHCDDSKLTGRFVPK
jgi:hypothetical protein